MHGHEGAVQYETMSDRHPKQVTSPPRPDRAPDRGPRGEPGVPDPAPAAEGRLGTMGLPGSRVEAGISALRAALDEASGCLGNAQRANDLLVEELNQVRESLAETSGERDRLRQKLEELVVAREEALRSAEAERQQNRYLVAQQDAFLASWLEDHEKALQQIRAERDEAVRAERELRASRERARSDRRPEDQEVVSSRNSQLLARAKGELFEAQAEIQQLTQEREKQRVLLLRLQAERDQAQIRTAELSRLLDEQRHLLSGAPDEAGSRRTLGRPPRARPVPPLPQRESIDPSERGTERLGAGHLGGLGRETGTPLGDVSATSGLPNDGLEALAGTEPSREGDADVTVPVSRAGESRRQPDASAAVAPFARQSAGPREGAAPRRPPAPAWDTATGSARAAARKLADPRSESAARDEVDPARTAPSPVRRHTDPGISAPPRPESARPEPARIEPARIEPPETEAALPLRPQPNPNRAPQPLLHKPTDPGITAPRFPRDHALTLPATSGGGMPPASREGRPRRRRKAGRISSSTMASVFDASETSETHAGTRTQPAKSTSDDETGPAPDSEAGSTRSRSALALALEASAPRRRRSSTSGYAPTERPPAENPARPEAAVRPKTSVREEVTTKGESKARPLGDYSVSDVPAECVASRPRKS